MLDTNPITLLMPIKNGEKYLNNAMHYLEENISDRDEILIINDNSTDRTKSILMKWAGRNSNVVVADNPRNGLVTALNYGLHQASHEWVARFDVDDRYPNSRIAETKRHIGDDVVMIFSDYQFTTDTGLPLGYMPSAIEAKKTYLSLVTSQRTAHPSVCFNRSSALEVGGYRDEDFPAEDLSLWLRMSTVGKLKSIPNNLLKYRLNGNSITGTFRSKSLEKKDILIKNFDFDSEVIESCLSELEISRAYYLNYRQGQKRYLLHLRDLFLILENNFKPNANILKFVRKKIYRELSNYPAAIELYGQMLVRKLYRML